MSTKENKNQLDICIPEEWTAVPVDEIPRIITDAMFPEIAGKEWVASTELPPKELWGTPALLG